MIVKFENTFHVQGFGRSRFQRGVVYNVPDKLRGHLPKSATILPDDYGKETSKEQEDLLAADFVRQQEEATDRAALEKAGLGGYAVEENNDLVVEALDDDVVEVVDTSKDLDDAVAEAKKKSAATKKK